MGVTVGLVANVYNEANALPGWLETHLPFFDDVRVLHAGPGGERSNDGTIEILEKWRVPVEFWAIDEGFGAVRTRAIRMSPCDYVMLLDADERFFPILPTIECSGEGTPQAEVDWILQSYDFRGVNLPNWENIDKLGAGLSCARTGVADQGANLRNLLETKRPDAVITVRRHWHDIAMRRPTQSWRVHPDWQMRLVRNVHSIYFDIDTRMHERLCGADKAERADVVSGPFFDHFHFTFKRMEQEQRAHDVAIYDAIHEGKAPPTRTEFWAGKHPFLQAVEGDL